MRFAFKADSVRECVLCTLCFISVISVSCASQLQCFMGNVSTTEKASIHLVNCTRPATVRPITTCLLFKYQTGADGSQNDTRLTYGGVGGHQFECDQGHVCERSMHDKSWIRNSAGLVFTEFPGQVAGLRGNALVAWAYEYNRDKTANGLHVRICIFDASFDCSQTTYNGRSGDLYCCHWSKCNDPRVDNLPQTSVPCFDGVTTANQTRGVLQPCATDQCLNITHGDTTKHRCDTEGQCSKHQLVQDCRQIKDAGISKRLCCCDKGSKGCNVGNTNKSLIIATPQHPPTHSTRAHHHHVVAPPAHITRDHPAVRPMDPMPPGLGPGETKEHKSRVAGIVSAAVLGVALVVLVVVIGLKQWQRYREKYNFSYMQLTADMMVL